MAPKKSTPFQQTTPAGSSSADESEDAFVSDESEEEADSSGSDSGSAEEATPTLKPDAKRNQQQSNAVPSPKSTAKQAVVAAAPADANVGKKRAREDTGNGKKVVETEVSKVGKDSKTPFARVFSEEDDIKVLKGMLDYRSSKGMDPAKNWPDFFNYVTKSLSAVDITLAQLRRKIRNLKEKYENNVRMRVATFDKPHDQLCYNLAEKIWGELHENGQMKSSMSIMHDLGKQIPPPVNNEEHVSLGKQILPSPVKEDSYYSLAELIKSKDASGMSLREDILKRGLELLGEEVRAGFDEEWKVLVMAEAELYHKRLELMCKQVKLILDAHKASRN